MGLKKPGELSAKQRERLGGWIALVEGEVLLLVYDETLFGSVGKGLAVTDRRIAKFDGEDVNSIPFGDLAELRVSGDGVAQQLTATGRLSGHFNQQVVLAEDRLMEEFLAPIRARVAEGVVQRSAKTASGSRFSAAGKPVRCHHCGGDRFGTRELMLNTRGLELFDLGWLNASATALECRTCGLLAVFTQTPAAIAD